MGAKKLHSSLLPFSIGEAGLMALRVHDAARIALRIHETDLFEVGYECGGLAVDVWITDPSRPVFIAGSDLPGNVPGLMWSSPYRFTRVRCLVTGGREGVVGPTRSSWPPSKHVAGMQDGYFVKTHLKSVAGEQSVNGRGVQVNIPRGPCLPVHTRLSRRRPGARLLLSAMASS
ncbi:hypothetical protein BHM03_00001108 [Ensete ventricosum]|uniref:Uncharacterized protein n=1 Tax=Ensete ventricosum TaxID=4639 RepID=A0A445M8Z8_ENSVE|nr:hypothetical protein BHM03_00001108 [Ensete ventricosum]